MKIDPQEKQNHSENGQVHSNTLGSKPLTQVNENGSSVAVTFRAVSAEQNNTGTLDLIPALTTLNETNHNECQKRSRCGQVYFDKKNQMFCFYVQLRAKQTTPFVNIHYENEVSLREKNLPLRYCQSLEMLMYF